MEPGINIEDPKIVEKIREGMMHPTMITDLINANEKTVKAIREGRYTEMGVLLREDGSIAKIEVSMESLEKFGLTDRESKVYFLGAFLMSNVYMVPTNHPTLKNLYRRHLKRYKLSIPTMSELVIKLDNGYKDGRIVKMYMEDMEKTGFKPMRSEIEGFMYYFCNQIRKRMKLAIEKSKTPYFIQ